MARRFLADARVPGLHGALEHAEHLARVLACDVHAHRAHDLIGDHLHRGPAGAVPVRAAAHAVRDGEHVRPGVAGQLAERLGRRTRGMHTQRLVQRGHEKLILVATAHPPLVGEAGDVDLVGTGAEGRGGVGHGSGGGVS